MNNPAEPARDTHPANNAGAQREKLNTIPYDLFPFAEAVPAYCQVAEHGARKYEPWNWTKGLSRVQLACSASRHLWAILRGDNTDKDSGLPHTAHLLWNAVALVHNEHHKLEDGIRAEPARDYKASKTDVTLDKIQKHIEKYTETFKNDKNTQSS